MDTSFIKGIIVPIATPIDDNERLDEKTLERHIDYMIAQGISGILECGSNSEFYMLEEDEMEDHLKTILRIVAGRVPVYMGIGSIRTSKCVRIAKMAKRCGASAISILQPMFIHINDDELFDHVKRIAGAVPDLPVLLYNNPGRTGYKMSQDLVEKCAHEINNIVGIKDSSGDMTETEEFIRRNMDKNFRVMVGKDTVIFPGLTVGCVGAVCSTANYLPELPVGIYEEYMKGDLKKSLEYQFKLNPIRIETYRSTFPVATKDYSNILGRELGKPYLPTKPSSDKAMESYRRRLIEAGYLKDED